MTTRSEARGDGAALRPVDGAGCGIEQRLGLAGADTCPDLLLRDSRVSDLAKVDLSGTSHAPRLGQKIVKITPETVARQRPADLQKVVPAVAAAAARRRATWPPPTMRLFALHSHHRFHLGSIRQTPSISKSQRPPGRATAAPAPAGSWAAPLPGWPGAAAPPGPLPAGPRPGLPPAPPEPAPAQGAAPPEAAHPGSHPPSRYPGSRRWRAPPAAAPCARNRGEEQCNRGACEEVRDAAASQDQDHWGGSAWRALAAAGSRRSPAPPAAPPPQAPLLPLDARVAQVDLHACRVGKGRGDLQGSRHSSVRKSPGAPSPGEEHRGGWQQRF